MNGKRSRWRQRVSVRSGARRSRRGVSDVVATILLLALTVTLFAAVFAFVTSFPSPPAQSNNQFQASLFYPSNGTTKFIAGVRIVHLAGPQVSGGALIYLKSANQPGLSVFQAPYSVSSGIGGGAIWNLGQTWSLSFPATQLPLAGGNITVYILSQGQLLFSVILPGTTVAAPPTIVSTSTVPTVPAISQTFTVYASLAGAYKSNSVYVNLAGVPGGLATPQKMFQNAQGQWYYNLTGGATKNGTYFGYVNATGTAGAGQTAVGVVVITISSTYSAIITLSPTTLSHTVSQKVYINGTGFAASSLVSLMLNGSILGSPHNLTLTCATTGSYAGSSLSGSTITTTASGTFSCSITVPKAAGAALYTFVAYDYSSAQTATAYFSRT